MPILSRVIFGKAFTLRDEEFVQGIILVSEDYETIVDENFHVVTEFVEE